MRTETNTPGPGTPLTDAPAIQSTVNSQANRTLSDTDVVFYMDDQKTGLYCGVIAKLSFFFVLDYFINFLMYSCNRLLNM